MWNTLVEWDRTLLYLINRRWSNGFFDDLLPFVREAEHWLPLYVFLLGLACWRAGTKSGLLWYASCATTAGLSDIVSSHLIKKTVERARPCHLMEELPELILRVHCGSGYSFTSSHATNHMALAVFVVLTATGILGRWRWLFLPWAVMIGFAQIYVGVHYPGDVLSGFLLGAILGWLSAHFYGRYLTSS